MKQILIMITICAFLQSCKTPLPLITVNEVNIEKYTGLWYEIAAYPNRFEKNCYCTTAEYNLSEKGHIIVENRCRKGSVTGEETGIKGKAFVVKNSSNTKLKVQFFWPFRGDYWIIGLASDYSWAVVSSPSRKYLWVLSRSKTMDDATYESVMELVLSKGLNPEKLKRTVQE